MTEGEQPAQQRIPFLLGINDAIWFINPRYVGSGIVHRQRLGQLPTQRIHTGPGKIFIKGGGYHVAASIINVAHHRLLIYAVHITSYREGRWQRIDVKIFY